MELTVKDLSLRKYSRQMIMPELGVTGQYDFQRSKVLVVGAGGIGSTVIQYLVSAGIPTDVIDFDSVEESNLHRQIIHSEDRIGINKAESAVCHLSKLNSAVPCSAFPSKLTAESAMHMFPLYTVIVDATDNFEARYVISDACVRTGRAFVTGSAAALEGQITVIRPFQTACYRCLYPVASSRDNCRSCANVGVLGPIAGMIGCLQATETMKLLLLLREEEREQSSELSNICQKKRPRMDVLSGRQVLYDARSGEFNTYALPGRDPHCSACGDGSVLPCAALMKAKVMGKQSVPASAVESVSVRHYADQLRDSKERPHLLLDVRSREQFAMISLKDYYIRDGQKLKVFSELEECVEYIASVDNTGAAFDGRESFVVNLPLLSLRAEDVPKKEREQKQLQILAWITAICTHCNRDSRQPCAVYTLCRRGIDSVLAAEYLTAQNSLNLPIRNVTGGFEQWSRDVDPTFPIY